MHRNLRILESIRATKQATPCISIYLNRPGYFSADEVSSISLYRELAYAKGLLRNSWSNQKSDDYLKPLLKVAKDELRKSTRGTLAFFHSGDATSCIHLPEAAPSRTVVADDFHVKPLVKLVQSSKSPTLGWALNLCHRAMAEARALTELYQIVQAFKTGKVQCLWVAEDVTIWGILNRKRGTIVLHPRQLNHRDGDVLDDLAEWGFDQGIEVHLLPLHQIPGQYPAIVEI